MKRVAPLLIPKKITAVTPFFAARSLEVKWEDGQVSRVGLTPWIAEHADLALLETNRNLFDQARVGQDGFSVVWTDEEIEIDSLHLWLLGQEQKGLVITPDAFRRWRGRHGLTQAGAARALGISPRMVAYYEAGRSFIPTTVGLACAGFSATRGHAA